MASNHLTHLDKTLNDCYQFDLDWTLLPPSLHKICLLFGKGLKQRESTILIGILLTISFCMGHSCVEVHSFWTEPVILWVATVLSTGRCKSAFHGFIAGILAGVADKVKEKGSECKPMIMPHCTWDKFGDLLAESGARSFGLYDELMAFFSSMNMYSSSKMQVSDTKEYQDFLQMYTGKTKTRETVTGNANFSMKSTSFTILGFTQPQAALPVIKDQANNSKGFTSRFLWYFPKPIFCSMDSNILTAEEEIEASTFKIKLVDLLAQLYIQGESTFEIEDVGKIRNVSVKERMLTLSPEARQSFVKIHDDWELNICKKYANDSFIGGIFSRGKSQVIRFSATIEVLLSMLSEMEDIDNMQQDSQSSQISDNVASTCWSGNENDAVGDDASDAIDNDTNGAIGDSDGSDGQSDSDKNDDNESVDGVEFQFVDVISSRAIDVAYSLVNSSLSQLCLLNDKGFAMNNTDLIETTDDLENIDNIKVAEPQGLFKLFKAVLLTPGKIVSFSILNYKGLFRRNEVNSTQGRQLMLTVVEQIKQLEVGDCETYTIPGNKSQVHFFVKYLPPPQTNAEEALQFAKKIAKAGVSLQKYTAAFDVNDDESIKHLSEYNNKKENNVVTPSKKRKLF